MGNLIEPWNGRRAGEAQMEICLLIVWKEEQEDQGSQWTPEEASEAEAKAGKEAEF